MALPRNPNAFANSPLDRAAHHRRDQTWLDAALAAPTTELIAFHERRPFIVDREGVAEAGWMGAHAAAAISPAGAPLVFLGLDANGGARFAIEIPDAAPLVAVGRFEELRGIGPSLDAGDLAILGCARSLFDWHARHRFCANCGASSEIAEAGWKRVCPACNSEHFPRVDPVVIMVPVFGERVLLGRQAKWPKGMHSALAGFMEPGETIEEAVARETLEEAGLVVTNVRLHSTQPWPFPSQLMIGVIAEVEHDNAKVDEHELEAVRWFTREEARQLIAGKHPECWAPPSFAIAHQLIKSWAE
ncbi:MAG TPA: NAD(+) diphosphatase [Caulobacterales bacterium]|nr:NAD(+) diphosphatase [Caulobacterales bacterium]